MSKLIAGATTLMFFIFSAFMGYALNPNEEQGLAAVEQYLKQIEANLQLAQETAGPGEGTPPASKAKLAKLRLDQAAVYLPVAGEELNKLPAGDPGVKTVRDRYETASLAVQVLNDRLSGKNPAPAASSKPTPPALAASTSPSAAAGPKKLDYRQEEQLKGAQFNLREAEGNAQTLTELVERLKPVQDQNSIDHRLVVTAMNTVVNAERKAGFAEDTLKQLPQEGVGIGETQRRLQLARASIATSVEFLDPLHEKLMELIAPATYPTIRNDFKRIQELSIMYGNPTLFQTNRPEAAMLLTQKDAAQDEVKRLGVVYGPLINQKTELANQLEGAIKGFIGNFNAFVATANSLKATLPLEIQTEIATANRLANEAVQRQNALFFTGGIPQHMDLAEEKLALLLTIEAEAGRKLAEEVAQQKASLVTRQKSLESLIIKETPVPADRYHGSDKNQLAGIAESGWKVQQPDAALLGCSFPAEQWSRTTRWEYSGGVWTFVDFSKIQVQLLVKHNDELAVIRPVNLKKDHQKGDNIIAIPLDNIRDEIIPQRYVLLKKIR